MPILKTSRKISTNCKLSAPAAAILNDMKRHLLILLSILAFLPAAFAQKMPDKSKMKEDLQKFKIDYVACEMKLSEKEKAEFIPIYKEYCEKRMQANSGVWKLERDLRKNKDASPEDYKKLSLLQQKAREKDHKITKQYDAKLEKFLNAKQIYEMHRAEERFFDKMKEMKKKHSGSPEGNEKRKPLDGKRKAGKANPAPPSCEP